MHDQKFEKKWQELQEYVPFLQRIINNLKKTMNDRPRPVQLEKMEMLYDVLTKRDKNKLKYESLIKCETLLNKIYNKVEKTPQKQATTSLETVEILEPDSPPVDNQCNETYRPPIEIPTERTESPISEKSNLSEVVPVKENFKNSISSDASLEELMKRRELLESKLFSCVNFDNISTPKDKNDTKEIETESAKSSTTQKTLKLSITSNLKSNKKDSSEIVRDRKEPNRMHQTESVHQSRRLEGSSLKKDFDEISTPSPPPFERKDKFSKTNKYEDRNRHSSSSASYYHAQNKNMDFSNQQKSKSNITEISQFQRNNQRRSATPDWDAEIEEEEKSRSQKTSHLSRTDKGRVRYDSPISIGSNSSSRERSLEKERDRNNRHYSNSTKYHADRPTSRNSDKYSSKDYRREKDNENYRRSRSNYKDEADNQNVRTHSAKHSASNFERDSSPYSIEKTKSSVAKLTPPPSLSHVTKYLDDIENAQTASSLSPIDSSDSNMSLNYNDQKSVKYDGENLTIKIHNENFKSLSKVKATKVQTPSITDVLKSPPLSANDIDDLLHESDLNNTEPTPTDETALLEVRKKLAKLSSKLNLSKKTDVKDIDNSKQLEKDFEISSPTNSNKVDRLALKYNPHLKKTSPSEKPIEQHSPQLIVETPSNISPKQMLPISNTTNSSLKQNVVHCTNNQINPFPAVNPNDPRLKNKILNLPDPNVLQVNNSRDLNNSKNINQNYSSVSGNSDRAPLVGQQIPSILNTIIQPPLDIMNQNTKISFPPNLISIPLQQNIPLIGSHLSPPNFMQQQQHNRLPPIVSIPQRTFNDFLNNTGHLSQQNPINSPSIKNMNPSQSQISYNKINPILNDNFERQKYFESKKTKNYGDQQQSQHNHKPQTYGEYKRQCELERNRINRFDSSKQNIKLNISASVSESDKKDEIIATNKKENNTSNSNINQTTSSESRLSHGTTDSKSTVFKDSQNDSKSVNGNTHQTTTKDTRQISKQRDSFHSKNENQRSINADNSNISGNCKIVSVASAANTTNKISSANAIAKFKIPKKNKEETKAGSSLSTDMPKQSQTEALKINLIESELSSNSHLEISKNKNGECESVSISQSGESRMEKLKKQDETNSDDEMLRENQGEILAKQEIPVIKQEDKSSDDIKINELENDSCEDDQQNENHEFASVTKEKETDSYSEIKETENSSNSTKRKRKIELLKENEDDDTKQFQKVTKRRKSIASHLHVDEKLNDSSNENSAEKNILKVSKRRNSMSSVTDQTDNSPYSDIESKQLVKESETNKNLSFLNQPSKSKDDTESLGSFQSLETSETSTSQKPRGKRTKRPINYFYEIAPDPHDNSVLSVENIIEGKRRSRSNVSLNENALAPATKYSKPKTKAADKSTPTANSNTTENEDQKNDNKIAKKSTTTKKGNKKAATKSANTIQENTNADESKLNVDKNTCENENVEEEKENPSSSNTSNINPEVLQSLLSNLLDSNSKNVNLLGVLSKVCDEKKLEKIKAILEEDDKADQKDDSQNKDTIKNENKKDATDSVEKPANVKELNGKPTKEKKHKHKTELDRLNEDIRDMFISEGVLAATGKRSISQNQANKEDSIPQAKSQANESINVKTSTKNSSPTVENEDQNDISIDSNSAVPIKKAKIILKKMNLGTVDKQGRKMKGNSKRKRSSWARGRIAKKKCVGVSTKLSSNRTNPSVLQRNENSTFSSNLKKGNSNDEDLDDVEDHHSFTKPCPKSKKKYNKRKQSDSKGRIVENSFTSQIADNNKIKIQRKVLKNVYSYMHAKSEYSKKCIYCDKNIPQNKVVTHCINSHPQFEIFISRLPPDTLEDLSMDNFNSAAYKYSTKKCLMFHYRCPFCDIQKTASRAGWLDHFKTHTGEFRYKCVTCNKRSNNYKKFEKHKCKKIDIKTLECPVVVKNFIPGFLCNLCKYIQLIESNIVKHLASQHSAKGKRNFSQIKLLNMENVPKFDSPPEGEVGVEEDDEDQNEYDVEIDDTENTSIEQFEKQLSKVNNDRLEVFIPNEQNDLNLDKNFLSCYMNEMSFSVQSPKLKPKSSKSIVDELSERLKSQNQTESSNVSESPTKSKKTETIVDILSKRINRSSSENLEIDESLINEPLQNLDEESHDSRHSDELLDVEDTTPIVYILDKIEDDNLDNIELVESSEQVIVPINKPISNVRADVLEKIGSSSFSSSQNNKTETIDDKLSKSIYATLNEKLNKQEKAKKVLSPVKKLQLKKKQDGNPIIDRLNKRLKGIRQSEIDETNNTSLEDKANESLQRKQKPNSSNDHLSDSGEENLIIDENPISVEETSHDPLGVSIIEDDDDCWEDIEVVSPTNEMTTTNEHSSSKNTNNKNDDVIELNKKDTILKTLSKIYVSFGKNKHQKGKTIQSLEKPTEQMNDASDASISGDTSNASAVSSQQKSVSVDASGLTGAIASPVSKDLATGSPLPLSSEPLSDLNDISEILEPTTVADTSVKSNAKILPKNSDASSSNTSHINIPTTTVNIREINEPIYVLSENATIEEALAIANEIKNSKKPENKDLTEQHSCQYRINNLGFINNKGKIKYLCLMQPCSFLFSNEEIGLQNHYRSDHKGIFWDGYCYICEQFISNISEYELPLDRELMHMIEVHVKSFLKTGSLTENLLNQNSDSNKSFEEALMVNRPKIKIRRLSGDLLSINKPSSPAKIPTTTVTSSVGVTSNIGANISSISSSGTINQNMSIRDLLSTPSLPPPPLVKNVLPTLENSAHLNLAYPKPKLPVRHSMIPSTKQPIKNNLASCSGLKIASVSEKARVSEDEGVSSQSIPGIQQQLTSIQPDSLQIVSVAGGVTNFENCIKTSTIEVPQNKQPNNQTSSFQSQFIKEITSGQNQTKTRLNMPTNIPKLAPGFTLIPIGHNKTSTPTKTTAINPISTMSAQQTNTTKGLQQAASIIPNNTLSDLNLIATTNALSSSQLTSIQPANNTNFLRIENVCSLNKNINTDLNQCQMLVSETTPSVKTVDSPQILTLNQQNKQISDATALTTSCLTTMTTSTSTIEQPSAQATQLVNSTINKTITSSAQRQLTTIPIANSTLPIPIDSASPSLPPLNPSTHCQLITNAATGLVTTTSVITIETTQNSLIDTVPSTIATTSVISMGTSIMSVAKNTPTSMKLLQPWLCHTVSKPIEIAQFQLRALSLYATFKCMSMNCIYTTSSAIDIVEHFKNHEKEQLNSTNSISNERDWLRCCYCSFTAQSPTMFVEHINSIHQHDIFQCSHCFYRSCNDFNVLKHMEEYHSGLILKILICHGERKRLAAEMKHLAIYRAQYIKAIPCNDCPKQFFILRNYLKHLSEHNQITPGYTCGICKTSGLLKMYADAHLSLVHRISVYQCIYCVMASNLRSVMYTHMAKEHPSNLLYSCVRVSPNKHIKHITVPIETIENSTVLANLSEAVHPDYLQQCSFSVEQLNSMNPSLDPESVWKNKELFLVRDTPMIISESSVTRSPAQINLQTGLKIASVTSLVPQHAEKPEDQTLFVTQNTDLLASKANQTSASKTTAENQDMSSNEKNNRINCQELHETITIDDDSDCDTSANVPLFEISIPDSAFEDNNLNSQNKAQKWSKTYGKNSSETLTTGAHLQEPQHQQEQRHNITISGNLSEHSSNTIDTELEVSKEFMKKVVEAAKEYVSETGYEGSDLYRCSAPECFNLQLNSDTLSYHYTTAHPRSRHYRCPHCTSQYNNIRSLKTHLATHKRHRYFCFLCNHTSSIQPHMTKHMSELHSFGTGLILYPLAPPVETYSTTTSSNTETLFFVLSPPGTCQREILQFGERLIRTCERRRTLSKKSFSPDEIDELPMQAIFNSEVFCSLCSYRTKVRTNMFRHLLFHKSEVKVSSIDPVNPVPCLVSNEKNFDKMINMALSSNLNSQSKKESNNDKPSASSLSSALNAAIQNSETVLKPDSAEVTAVLKKLNNKYPEYIPVMRRYICGVPNCNYLTITDAMLKCHLQTLHSEEKSYTCPHCKSEIMKRSLCPDKVLLHLKYHDTKLFLCSECAYMHFLKHVVERHINDRHGKQVDVIQYDRKDTETVITKYPVYKITFPEKSGPVASTSSSASRRESLTNDNNTEETTVLNAEDSISDVATTSENVNVIDGVNDSTSEEFNWICTTCKHKTEDEITMLTHINSKHSIRFRYGCCVCKFGAGKINLVKEHISDKHHNFQQRQVKSNYCRIDESDHEIVQENRPLWTRSDPYRIKHIRGILMEDEHQQSKATRKSKTKKSNNSANNSFESDNLNSSKKKLVEEKSSDSTVIQASNTVNTSEDVVLVNESSSSSQDSVDKTKTDSEALSNSENSLLKTKSVESASTDTTAINTEKHVEIYECYYCPTKNISFKVIYTHWLLHHCRKIAEKTTTDGNTSEKSDKPGPLLAKPFAFKVVGYISADSSVEISSYDVTHTQLLRLLKMGSRVTRFQCNKCWRLFANSISVSEHQKNEHANTGNPNHRCLTFKNRNFFICSACGYASSLECKTAAHLLNHYEGLKKCTKCNKDFDKFLDFIRHLPEHDIHFKDFIKSDDNIRDLWDKIIILFPNGLCMMRCNIPKETGIVLNQLLDIVNNEVDAALLQTTPSVPLGKSNLENTNQTQPNHSPTNLPQGEPVELEIIEIDETDSIEFENENENEKPISTKAEHSEEETQQNKLENIDPIASPVPSTSTGRQTIETSEIIKNFYKDKEQKTQKKSRNDNSKKVTKNQKNKKKSKSRDKEWTPKVYKRRRLTSSASDDDDDDDDDDDYDFYDEDYTDDEISSKASSEYIYEDDDDTDDDEDDMPLSAVVLRSSSGLQDKHKKKPKPFIGPKFTQKLYHNSVTPYSYYGTKRRKENFDNLRVRVRFDETDSEDFIFTYKQYAEIVPLDCAVIVEKLNSSILEKGTINLLKKN